MKIMATCAINSWKTYGAKVETVIDFVFLDSTITVDSDCGHGIKKNKKEKQKQQTNKNNNNKKTHLLLGGTTMTNLETILKPGGIILLTNIHLVKPMIIPVVMYGCENWTIKKAEHQGIDDFKLWRWRKLLRVPWAARRSNQSILKEINPEYSLECLVLKLQYFGHLM